MARQYGGAHRGGKAHPHASFCLSLASLMTVLVLTKILYVPYQPKIEEIATGGAVGWELFARADIAFRIPDGAHWAHTQ